MNCSEGSIFLVIASCIRAEHGRPEILISVPHLVLWPHQHDPLTDKDGKLKN